MYVLHIQAYRYLVQYISTHTYIRSCTWACGTTALRWICWWMCRSVSPHRSFRTCLMTSSFVCFFLVGFWRVSEARAGHAEWADRKVGADGDDTCNKRIPHNARFSRLPVVRENDCSRKSNGLLLR